MEQPKFCPHCGAERVGAMQFCASCGKRLVGSEPAAPAKKRLSPLKFGAIVVAGLVVLCVFLSATGLGLKLLGAVPGPRVQGMEGHLTSTGPNVLVARDIAAYDQVSTAGSQDLPGLIGADRIFLVTTGTRVRVLQVDVPRSHVQILDGLHASEDGWVLASFVQQ